jgi:hypothetical protein
MKSLRVSGNLPKSWHEFSSSMCKFAVFEGGGIVLELQHAQKISTSAIMFAK